MTRVSRELLGDRRGIISANTRCQHAMSLLSGLLDMRTDDPDRPIIFVTHSLGGILIKDALHKSCQPTSSPRYTPLFTSTHSILFLGTPNHGSTYARVGRSLASKICFIFRDTNSNLLRSLEYDSEILERISDDFRNTLAESESRGKRIRVASFAEELSMRGLTSPIVHTRSAFIRLPDEITETIWAHHRDLCRFGDEFDQGYNSISRRIVEFAADASVGSESERSRLRLSLEDVGLVEDVDDEDSGVARREDVQV
ncbi:hypothetical protein B0J14DRAFT_557998 [Halenospora varia]|nr:hypothetical protein B0J14DRAFT_557998 [Halenospora varia]